MTTSLAREAQSSCPLFDWAHCDRSTDKVYLLTSNAKQAPPFASWLLEIPASTRIPVSELCKLPRCPTGEVAGEHKASFPSM